MKEDRFQELLLSQLDEAFSRLSVVRRLPRPRRGWLRTLRRGLGLKLSDVAKKLGSSPQHALYFEKAEAEDRITLKSLRAAAEAIECELFYVLLPKGRSLRQVAQDTVHNEVSRELLAIQHTMALENQAIAPNKLRKKILSETRRRAE